MALMFYLIESLSGSFSISTIFPILSCNAIHVIWEVKNGTTKVVGCHMLNYYLHQPHALVYIEFGAWSVEEYYLLSCNQF